MTTNPGFYLGVGRVMTESVTSKIKTAGSSFVIRMLNSRPENWERIAEVVERDDLTGAIVKLTANDFRRIASDKYGEAADALFGALSKKRHLLLVHEEIVTPQDPELESGNPGSAGGPDRGDDDDWMDDSGWQNDDWNDHIARDYFGTLPQEIRDNVKRRLADHSLTITTYKRNAEASIFATAFVEDTLNNLLFRLYVPAGRLYEEELARVIELFHDWLGSVKGQTVRQSGYRTPSGRVIEFFGEPGMSAEVVSDELQEFAQFLSVVEDSPTAQEMLQSLGLTSGRARELVAKYAKAARRVLVDTKHERERLILSIQQQLESELVDELPGASAADLGDLIAQLVPESPFAASEVTRRLAPGPAGGSPILNVQIIERVEGIVAQNVNGPVTVGTPAAQLIELIRQFGDTSAEALEANARELADTEAPPAARLRARQALKNFLLRNAARIEQSAYKAAQEWVVHSIGEWLS
ncbi:hypothetical protein WJX64_06900 [Leifsonia sp. YIM 134122]|uniref:Uncharacterized protein n=1 Tax=Leifsonia stereocauli TaxID=3134136 RepID=A0ABU9W2N9_9MICO